MIFAPPGGLPVTGLPFGKNPDAPAEFIVRDCFRLCVDDAAALCVAPFILFGAPPIVGTAGGTGPRPVTGDPSDLPDGPDGIWRLGRLIVLPEARPAAPGDCPPRDAEDECAGARL